MQFIQVAYCITVPLLLLGLLVAGGGIRKLFTNLLAVSNLLLIGYSIFLVRKLVALYQFSRQFQLKQPEQIFQLDLMSIRLLLVIFLPWFFLYRPLRQNRWYSLLLLLLLYWNDPVYSWNDYDLFTKIPVYLSACCSGYALLWLQNELPYQSRNT
ncbi:MAG: hypothetical protein IM584_08620 [Chitinophagaceae bacterium]|nr:hypothetical protein [Chitinophagaceae bacterium]MEA3425209.1 hypothetical protein [Bacteroidota bacterium]MCA6452589.1 hypothetical protein [Chitinophagaceae bacterium]MCA6456180.1 hypothetical protein [Chitinophagaceae bacterium]MCA6458022.1 hypothetical protein [Chitinophagaceae bacterium]